MLQEFYVQATRPTKADPLARDSAVSLIESWLRFRVIETTVPLVQQALATAARWRVSYWDAAIIEAARIGNCPVVLSEDLQPGMNFAGVTVQNPFAWPGVMIQSVPAQSTGVRSRCRGGYNCP